MESLYSDKSSLHCTCPNRIKPASLGCEGLLRDKEIFCTEREGMRCNKSFTGLRTDLSWDLLYA